jgi:energy-coupling factor transporter ATP-binding protein EcfA2
MIILKEKTISGKFKEYCDHILIDGYIISEQNEQVYRNFILTLHEQKKGVILMGNPGSGKTFLFDVMQKITHPMSNLKFSKVNCLDVVLSFNQNGHEVFNNYTKTNVLFDDLGTESKGIYYGDKIEVFEKFIQFRYDLFMNKGIKTHFTTNLTPIEISERYGLRCASRLNEMCEYLVLGGNSNYTDNRKLSNFKGFLPVYHEIKKSQEDIEWEESYKKMTERYALIPQKSSEPNGIGSILRKNLGL